MFLGTYAPKLDEKGRVILPAKFRDELSTGIVMNLKAAGPTGGKIAITRAATKP